MATRLCPSGLLRWAGTSIPPTFPVQQFGRVTPSLQARYTVRGFERAAEQWPWLKVAFVWFWKRADYANQNQDWFWFRVADPDFSLQPVFYALRDATLLDRGNQASASSLTARAARDCCALVVARVWSTR